MDSMFAKAYKKEFLSDFNLVLIREDSEEPKNNELPEGSRETPVHGLLLMAKSEYFQRKMEGPLDSSFAPCEGTTNAKKRLYVQVAEHLWDAFDHMLYQMYHGTLPDDLSHAQALSIARVADSCQVPDCLECINKRFKSVAVEDLEWVDVVTFYSMEDTLRQGVLAPAGTTFAKKLNSRFQAFEEAWRDDEHRKAFLELPLGAVEVLAASNDLEVVSENTVATALGSWVAYDLPARKPAAKLLAQHLRLQHLTQAYTADVLLELPGIGQVITAKQLTAALQYTQASAAARNTLQIHDTMKPPRPKPTTSELQFKWSVKLDDIMAIIRKRLDDGEVGHLASGVHNYNGFVVEMRLLAGTSQNDKPFMYIYVTAGCEMGSKISVKSATLSGKVQMPGAAAGSNNHMLSLTRIVFPTTTTFYCRHIALGTAGVHDAATLVTALCAHTQTTASVAAAALGRVQDLQEVVFSCTISECV